MIETPWQAANIVSREHADRIALEQCARHWGLRAEDVEMDPDRQRIRSAVSSLVLAIWDRERWYFFS